MQVTKFSHDDPKPILAIEAIPPEAQPMDPEDDEGFTVYRPNKSVYFDSRIKP